MDEGVFGRAAQERAIAEVEAEMARLCELLAEGLAMGLDEGREMVGGAMSEFLVEFFDLVRAKGSRPGMKGMITLPLLVHGAETGDPAPAAPVAVIHLLWWASARYLDDLTDAAPAEGAASRTVEAPAAGKKILTALAVGGQLPGRIIAGLPAGAAVRAAVADEVSRGWLDAVDGQLRDLTERAPVASPGSVLRGYEGKTGAPYAMAAASAACLAASAAAGSTAGARTGARSACCASSSTTSATSPPAARGPRQRHRDLPARPPAGRAARRAPPGGARPARRRPPVGVRARRADRLDARRRDHRVLRRFRRAAGRARPRPARRAGRRSGLRPGTAPAGRRDRRHLPRFRLAVA